MSSELDIGSQIVAPSSRRSHDLAMRVTDYRGEYHMSSLNLILRIFFEKRSVILRLPLFIMLKIPGVFPRYIIYVLPSTIL